MGDNRKALGHRGENIAVIYLEEKGHIILDRNFRCNKGEIDIIAQKDTELIFVEVRSRSTQNYGAAIESVNLKKQQQLRKLALIYLQKYHRREVNCSFDVITVQFNSWNDNPIIQHYPQAF